MLLPAYLQRTKVSVENGHILTAYDSLRLDPESATFTKNL